MIGKRELRQRMVIFEKDFKQFTAFHEDTRYLNTRYDNNFSNDELVIFSNTRVVLLRFAVVFVRIYYRYVCTAFGEYVLHCLTLLRSE